VHASACLSQHVSHDARCPAYSQDWPSGAQVLKQLPGVLSVFVWVVPAQLKQDMGFSLSLDRFLARHYAADLGNIGKTEIVN
jgi:hypothetical protein